jgi:hypothetical protein
MSRSSGFGVGFDQAVVGVLIQQLGDSRGVIWLEAEEPAFAQRIFVDQFRAASSAGFTSTTSPSRGMYTPLAAFTDSTVAASAPLS